jgi:hypothetical protein
MIRPGAVERSGTFRPAIAAAVLACSACQPPLDVEVKGAEQPAAAARTPAQAPTAQPLCSTFTVPVTVGGQQQHATVESCQQADGSWQITQYTPGLPAQVYVVPPPPIGGAFANPDYSWFPYSDPYWIASPWIFGLGPTIFVAQRFPRFHHGFGHAFNHGAGHGFGRGMQRAGGMGGRHR